MRVIAILANTLLFFFGNPAVVLFGYSVTIFDLVGMLIALVLFIVFIVSTLSQARELCRIDPQSE